MANIQAPHIRGETNAGISFQGQHGDKLTVIRRRWQIGKRHSSSNGEGTATLSAELRVAEGDVLFDSRGRAYKVARVEPSTTSYYMGEMVLASLQPLQSDTVYFGSGQRLTARESQVAGLLACRATNAEIVASLGVSSHTARNHTRHVLEKLGLTSKADVRKHRLSRGRDDNCEQGVRSSLTPGT